MQLPLEHPRRIIDETNYLFCAREGLSEEELLRSETLKRAFVRRMEIVGEAPIKTATQLKEKYPGAQGQAMAVTRDLLIHHYFGVD